jgi:hypothetical protein
MSLVVPVGDFLLSGSPLYGMTVGGNTADMGTAFALLVPVPDPSSFLLTGAGAAGLLVRVCRKPKIVNLAG